MTSIDILVEMMGEPHKKEIPYRIFETDQGFYVEFSYDAMHYEPETLDDIERLVQGAHSQIWEGRRNRDPVFVEKGEKTLREGAISFDAYIIVTHDLVDALKACGVDAYIPETGGNPYLEIRDELTEKVLYDVRLHRKDSRAVITPKVETIQIDDETYSAKDVLRAYVKTLEQKHTL